MRSLITLVFQEMLTEGSGVLNEGLQGRVYIAQVMKHVKKCP